MIPSRDRLSEWRDRLSEYRSSGLTVAAWCRKNGLSEFTYYYWRRRIASSSACAPTAVVEQQWLPLAVTVEGSTVQQLTVRIGRAEIDVSAGFDPGLLASVVKVLEGRHAE
jgi:hypothetical protein